MEHATSEANRASPAFGVLRCPLMSITIAHAEMKKQAHVSEGTEQILVRCDSVGPDG